MGERRASVFIHKKNFFVEVELLRVQPCCYTIGLKKLSANRAFVVAQTAVCL